MPAESVAGTSQTPSPKRRNHRKARKPFDGRYVLGRRVKQLVNVFRTRIGPDADDPVTATAIRRCAETVALSEDLRARMLRGESINADHVLRLSRTADLLTRRLHLDRHRRPEGPSLGASERKRWWRAMTRAFLCDGYTDKPTTPRAAMEFEIERLKMLSWADPGDRELKEEIERLQAELRALDGGARNA